MAPDEYDKAVAVHHDRMQELQSKEDECRRSLHTLAEAQEELHYIMSQKQTYTMNSPGLGCGGPELFCFEDETRGLFQDVFRDLGLRTKELQGEKHILADQQEQCTKDFRQKIRALDDAEHVRRQESR
jgi:hypothetical protein